MGYEVTTTEVSFPSTEGNTTIYGTVWNSPELTKPKGVVQIVHGMAEYIGRYDDFARFLVNNGYVVCGHDHLGHGRSINSTDDLGHMPAANGNEVLINDVHLLREAVKGTFGEDLPYFIFGHSMGSFVTRAYIARYASGLSGAIICGTGNVPVALSKTGHRLAKDTSKRIGERSRVDLLHNMAEGAYGKAIKDARTDLDWLSYNEENVDAYIADDMCGYMFTAGGYTSLMALTAEVATTECASKVPAGLPLFYIAGSEDPVGENGKGVRSAAKLAIDAGSTDVSLKLYDGMRHEILNERERERVYHDVLSWIGARA